MTEKTFPYWAWIRLRDKLCSEGPFTTKLLQSLGSVIPSKWACFVGAFRFFTLLGPRVLLCQRFASVEWCWIMLNWFVNNVSNEVCIYCLDWARHEHYNIFFNVHHGSLRWNACQTKDSTFVALVSTFPRPFGPWVHDWPSTHPLGHSRHYVNT